MTTVLQDHSKTYHVRDAAVDSPLPDDTFWVRRWRGKQAPERTVDLEHVLLAPVWRTGVPVSASRVHHSAKSHRDQGRTVVAY